MELNPELPAGYAISPALFCKKQDEYRKRELDKVKKKKMINIFHKRRKKNG
jgi:hypothetical protein